MSSLATAPDAPVFDVAIVGFGPTGAVAAALLGQAGLNVHVCDLRESASCTLSARLAAPAT